MDSIQLTTNDFQEVISSLLMAELPYDARMRYSQGASLGPGFVPSPDNLPEIHKIIDTIWTMFNVPMKKVSEGSSIRQWAEILNDEWKETEQKITFLTSGSTGEPKPTTHDYILHVQEVRALAKIFHDRTRIVSFVPRHHIYGFLFSILLPKALQVEVRWEVPLPTPGLAKSLSKGDLMVAFPLLWGKLKEMGTKFGAGIDGVTSTGPCPAETIHEICTNGLNRMFEIYGSSETGGVGYRSNPDNNYALLPYWSKSDDASCLERNHPVIGKQKHILQDILKWADTSNFIPKKRSDNAVQVAGINVYPSRVREILLQHPKIDDCAVRLMRPDEGTRLKVVFVPKSTQGNVGEIESSIREWAKKQLSPYEFPGDWTSQSKLPVNSLGKLKDW